MVSIAKETETKVRKISSAAYGAQRNEALRAMQLWIRKNTKKELSPDQQTKNSARTSDGICHASVAESSVAAATKRRHFAHNRRGGASAPQKEPLQGPSRNDACLIRFPRVPKLSRIPQSKSNSFKLIQTQIKLIDVDQCFLGLLGAEIVR